MQGMPNIISISILTGLKQTCKRSYRAHRKLGSGVEKEREGERVDEEKVKMRVSYWKIWEMGIWREREEAGWEKHVKIIN